MTNSKKLLISSTIIFFFSLLVFELIYEKLQIGLAANWVNGLFFLIKNVTCWSFVGINFNKAKLTTFLALATIVSIPEFFNYRLVSLDYDNLILKSIFYLISFILLNKWIFNNKLKTLYFVCLGTFIPFLNFEIANNYIHNYSILWPLFELNLIPILISKTQIIDIGFSFIQTTFYIFIIYCLNNKNDQNKSNRILNFVALKTIMYWSLASIGMLILGNNTLGLFSNKIGMLLFGLGFTVLLYFSSLVFYSFITKHYKFDEKTTFLLFLPIVDWVFLLFMPKIKLKFIHIKYAYIFIMIIFTIYQYFAIIRNVPISDTDLRNGYIFLNIVMPLLFAAFLVKSRKTILYSFCITMPFMIFIFSYLVIPLMHNIESQVSLSFYIQLILQFGLISYFIQKTNLEMFPNKHQ